MCQLSGKWLGRHFLLVFGAGLTLAGFALFFSDGERAGRIYFETIYKVYRISWDGLTAWIPFSLAWGWMAALLLWLVMGMLRISRQDRKGKGWRVLRGMFLVAVVHLAWFYWVWGFNYARPLSWDAPAFDSGAFYKELQTQIDRTVEARDELCHFPEFFGRKSDVQEIRDAVSASMQKMGLKPPGSPTCRALFPSGILLLFATSGVYLPFTGECLFDPGLHPLSQAFTIAHEFGHAFGVTDEGACNFIAYSACSRSPRPDLRYVAEFNYLRYLLAECRRRSPGRCQELQAALPAELRADLEALRRRHATFPAPFEWLRSALYSAFLKANGQHEGERAYHGIVALVIHYRQNDSEGKGSQ
ncbi:MAG: DUF3810 family protein [Saprospiraceae bacterium]|jgi:hypothetical protein|nr:DUF3810 family protein [Saprospiraceae bacterium]MBP9209899.1 DUF3810 family protein [Saprospiraceae bacterium]MBV6473113.1 hypothetical protein [Saprospiraceae bacterium]